MKKPLKFKYEGQDDDMLVYIGMVTKADKPEAIEKAVRQHIKGFDADYAQIELQYVDRPDCLMVVGEEL